MHKLIKITLLRKARPVRVYLLDAPAQYLIGRAHECAIQVPLIDEFGDVSRHHCWLEIDENQVHVCDLNSLNGTYVNNARIAACAPLPAPNATCVAEVAKAMLRSGDEIRLGRKARLVVEFIHVADNSVQGMRTIGRMREPQRGGGGAAG